VFKGLLCGKQVAVKVYSMCVCVRACACKGLLCGKQGAVKVYSNSARTSDGRSSMRPCVQGPTRALCVRAYSVASRWLSRCTVTAREHPTDALRMKWRPLYSLRKRVIPSCVLLPASSGARQYYMYICMHIYILILWPLYSLRKRVIPSYALSPNSSGARQ
jgi:hypothetical protein